jgi:NADH-quinone oxidoreductase subunit L
MSARRRRSSPRPSGWTQNDIKRVIAYSTCSQLGYMFVAMGVGAYRRGMFHLFTHAFFKALLFLGAGSVIHAMHHEQDMRAAGGPGTTAFLIGVFAALLTSFYSWRLVFLTFFGAPRWAGSEHIQHAVHDAHGHDDHAHDAHHDHHHGHDGTAGYHPHESPLNMLVPLVVLSLGAVLAGILFHGAFIDPEGGAHFWEASTLAFNEHLMHASHEVPLWVKWSPFAVMATGLTIAYMAYIRHTDWPAKFTAHFHVLYDFLLNKWYFDELYNAIFVKPAFAIGRFFWKRGDEGTIDRFGPNGMAALVVAGGRVTRRLQSGYLYTYALVMLLGLAAAVTWAITQS